MKPKIERYIYLSITFAKAEFKLRYEGSYLGIFWYLLNPLFTFLILFFIFSSSIGRPIIMYPLYLFLGVIIFNFFQQTTYDATRIIKENRYLIKSINFPLWTLIGAIVLKFLFSHIFELVVFFLFTLFLGNEVWTIIFYPFIALFFIIFIFGVSLLFAGISLYFVDFENIWLFASRLLWFATPLFYSIEGQKNLITLNLFNPLYYFITLAREVVIYSHVPSLWLVAGVICWTLFALAAGLLIFGELKTKIAERI